jgi:hypothetical protein
MNRRTNSLRQAWQRTLREEGARLLLLVSELNGDSRERLDEHWRRLAPGLKGIKWRLPNWPNVFASYVTHQADPRTLPQLAESERDHLQRFMDSWFAAKQSYAVWIDQFPDLANDLERSFKNVSIRFRERPDGGVGAVTEIEHPVADRTLNAAACRFGDFLRNPLRDVLAGRCKHCRRYFFNRKGYKGMVYCSQQCRWDVHNVDKKHFRGQVQQKLESSALSAMRKLLANIQERDFRGELSNDRWKLRVVGDVNRKHGTDFESKWLTRTINNPDGKYHRQFSRVRDVIEQKLGAARRGN